MRDPVEIENIEEMRRCAGIADRELREAIRGLRVGDLVRLTLVSPVSPSAKETLRVRITRIGEQAFCGRLIDRPACTGLASLEPEAPLTFTWHHIHSLLPRRATLGTAQK